MAIMFSKVIKAGERQREFNFRKIQTDSELKFHVDVPDDRGNRIFFQMQKGQEGRWTTHPAELPVWIQAAEENLSQAIVEHEAVPVKKK